jgi:enoyl-CoA hydratase/carnithine racemase
MRSERHGEITVVDLGDGENRLTPEWLAELSGLLSQLEAAQGPAALVTHASGSFYSNGYDLDGLLVRPAEEQRAFVADHERLLARLLVLPVPSVAALPGHAVGGGALVALAHDLRLQRADRGRWWLPEIDVRIPFRPAMLALLRLRLREDVLRDMVLGGERLGPEQALARGVVDETPAAEDLLPRALARAERLATKDRRTFARMKQRLYGAVAEQLLAGSAPVSQSRGGP